MTFSISESFATKPSYHCQSIGVYHASTGWLREQPLLDSRNHGLDAKLFVSFETMRAPHVHAMLKIHAPYNIRPIPSFLPSFARSFARSFVPLFAQSFLHSFVPSFVASLFPSIIRSFVHSCIHFTSFHFTSFHFISFHFMSSPFVSFRSNPLNLTRMECCLNTSLNILRNGQILCSSC